MPVGVMRARFILFYFETPTIGSPIPREFLLKIEKLKEGERTNPRESSPEGEAFFLG